MTEVFFLAGMISAGALAVTFSAYQGAKLDTASVLVETRALALAAPDVPVAEPPQAFATDNR